MAAAVVAEALGVTIDAVAGSEEPAGAEFDFAMVGAAVVVAGADFNTLEPGAAEWCASAATDADSTSFGFSAGSGGSADFGNAVSAT